MLLNLLYPSIFCFRKRILVIEFLVSIIVLVGMLLTPHSNIIARAEEKQVVVPLDQIVSGGPPPDGIPSIDSPLFISTDEGNKFLADSDKVVGININGDIRAYPLQILVWHEIVNDKIGGVPVAITYCPLCFTNQVFSRTVNNTILEFGTSGKLYNSNLVMYDRSTKSLWSQALGQGIAGKYAGINLQKLPFDLAYWKDWKQLYPQSKVLSKDTGSPRPYGADPYRDYYNSSDILFPISNRDNRLGLKEIVIGLQNDGLTKAYKLQDIEKLKVINDQLNNKSVILFSLYPLMVRAFDSSVDGQTLTFQFNFTNNNFTDKQTGSQWDVEGISVNGPLKGKQLLRLPFDEGYWFEWISFHPDSKIYS
jgi:hypothetical protein